MKAASSIARSTKNPFAMFGLPRVKVYELPCSQNGCSEQNGELSAPLSFHGPIRGPVSRLPACPDLMPVVAASIRVRVRVTRRNRQHLNGWNTRLRSAHDSVDEKIVEFSHVVTVGALYFDLAAKMVMVRKRVGPDDAEMTFAIGAHIHLAAFHWNSCIVDLCR